MRNNRLTLSILIIGIILLSIGCSINPKPKGYADVVEGLIEKQLKTRKTITVYNATVVDEHNFASYILEDKGVYDEVGYIHFTIDNNGKYKVIEIIDPDKIVEKAEGIIIYEFLSLKEDISQVSPDDFLVHDSIFIISNNPELSKIERIIDKTETQTIEVNTSPYITFFDDLDVDNKIEYIFYNKAGEIINLNDFTEDNNQDKIFTPSKDNVNTEMVEFSSYARSIDSSYNDESFDDLKNIYKISSEYMIEDDWYIIDDGYFQLGLLNYEEAKNVDFYISRLESGEGPILVFTDDDITDGWIYTNNHIEELIDKQRQATPENRFSYEPYFVIYADVTHQDGSIIRTPRLPIYNK